MTETVEGFELQDLMGFPVWGDDVVNRKDLESMPSPDIRDNGVFEISLVQQNGFRG